MPNSKYCCLLFLQSAIAGGVIQLLLLGFTLKCCSRDFSVASLSFFLCREDKGALAKLVEAVKTNYNERYDEVSVCLLESLMSSLCLEKPLV